MTESDVITPDAAPANSERRRRGGVSGMVLAELRELAGTLGVTDTTGMRRGDLINEIKKRQTEVGAGAAQLPLGDSAAADDAADAVEAAPVEAAPAEPAPVEAAPAESAPAEAAAADAAPADEKPARRRASRRRATTPDDAVPEPTPAEAVTATTDAPVADADAAVGTQAEVQDTAASEVAAPGSVTSDDAPSEARSSENGAPARRSRRSARRDAGPGTSGDGADSRSETDDAPAETPAETAPEDGGRDRGRQQDQADPDDDQGRDARGGRRRGNQRQQDQGRQQDRQQDQGQGRQQDQGQRDDRPQGQRNDRQGDDRQQGQRNDRQGDDRQQGPRNDRQDDRQRDDRQQQGQRQDTNAAGNQDDDDDEDGNGRRRGRRFRDRRRNRNERGPGGQGEGQQQDTREPEVRDDDVLIPVAGILDVLDNYAFVRTSGYMAGPNDVYVSLSLVRKYGLRRGDAVTGQVRQQRENEQNRQKFNPLVRVDSINGLDPEQAKRRPEFTKLTPLYPNQRLRLETESHLMSTRVIDLVMPVGKGQRALIVSPPKAGKTMVLQAIANAITTNNPEVHLMVVLVDERPEEVTDMQRTVKGEVIASTFDRPPSDHTSVAELSIERAKRLVEQGHDVVVLLDSITRLGRAYNLAAPASGRILSGGVDSTALYPPKRFLGAARNIEDGGSLTIFATALVETGSTMDTVIFEEFKGTGNAELKLDRKLADKRIFPAIDPDASSTRKEDLLLSPDEMAVTHKLRRVLAALDSQQAIELVLDRLRKTRTNIEFLMSIAKTMPSKDDE